MKTVYAIPGLNTTKELFDFLSLENVNLKILEWPAPEKGETMQSYAGKFMLQMDLTKPFYLLGVSFGGMISVEISELCKPLKTIIVSSAKSTNELPLFFRFIKLFSLHLILSEKMYLRFVPHCRKLIGFDKAFEPLFRKMVHSMPPHYYRRATNCIINWKRRNSPRNIIHIHGTSDRLLPFRYVNADYVIEGGNHAMIVYKAKEISEIINKEILK